MQPHLSCSSLRLPPVSLSLFLSIFCLHFTISDRHLNWNMYIWCDMVYSDFRCLSKSSASDRNWFVVLSYQYRDGLVLIFSLETLSGLEIYIRWQIYSVLEWIQFVSAQTIRQNPHLQSTQQDFPCKPLQWNERNNYFGISNDYAAASGETRYSGVILDSVVMGRWMGKGERQLVSKRGNTCAWHHSPAQLLIFPISETFTHHHKHPQTEIQSN